MSKSTAAIIIIAIMAGCMSASKLALDHFPLNYRYVDNQENKEIFLSYTNSTARPVCFGPENWPSNGVLLNNGSEVYIAIDGKRLFLRPQQDYCSQCTTKVNAGSTAVASLAYSSFGIPDSLKYAKKILFFNPMAYTCHPRDHIQNTISN
jgi:hypothetical protein